MAISFGKIAVWIAMVHLVCIAMLPVGGVNYVAAEEDTLISDFVKINDSETMANASTALDKSGFNQSTSGYTSGTALSMWSAFAWGMTKVKVLFSYLTAPMTLLAGMGAPWAIQLMVGGIMAIMYFLGLLGFIMGRDT